MGFIHEIGAFVLLFSSAHNKAIRVEVPGLALEFTDGLYIGRDPEGTLHFSDRADFNKVGTHYYTVYTNMLNGSPHCVVDFRFNSPTATPYAQFIGEDPTNAVFGTGMNNYSGTGNWQRLSVSFSTATVVKPAYSQTLTVTIESIGKVGTFTPQASIFSVSSFRVDGQLYYKSLADIGKGTWANYNNDRIVFYENDYTGRDFQAFFIPLDFGSTSDSLQVKPENTVTISGGYWR